MHVILQYNKSDTNFALTLQNTSNSESSGSEWECSAKKTNTPQNPHFSVTSYDAGHSLKLKLAAVPPRKGSCAKKALPNVKKKNVENSKIKGKLNKTKKLSSSSSSCSKCSSDSSSEDDLPLKVVSKAVSRKAIQPKATSVCDEHVNRDVKDARGAKDKQNAKVPNVKKNKSEDVSEGPHTRGRGRPRAKVSGIVSFGKHSRFLLLFKYLV